MSVGSKVRGEGEERWGEGRAGTGEREGLEGGGGIGGRGSWGDMGTGDGRGETGIRSLSWPDELGRLYFFYRMYVSKEH